LSARGSKRGFKNACVNSKHTGHASIQNLVQMLGYCLQDGIRSLS
jgi:hypothetical protein